MSGRSAVRRAVGLVTALCVLLGSGAAVASTAFAGPVWVGVDRAPLTSPLPTGFLGVALEVSTIPQWVGGATTPAQVNPVLVQLIRNLTPGPCPFSSTNSMPAHSSTLRSAF